MMFSRRDINLVLGLMLPLILTATTTTKCFGNPTGNDTTSESSRPSAPSLVPAVVIQQRPENVLSPYDGVHHYEQLPNEQIRDGSKPLVQLMDVPMISSSNNDADLYIGVSKPEPRNEIEDTVLQPQSTGHDPAIIDHRPPGQQQSPSPAPDSQQSTVASTDPGQQQITSTQAPPVTGSPPATSAPIITYNVTPQVTVTSAPSNQPQAPPNYATSSQQQVTPQTQTAAISQPKQSQPVSQNWYSAQPPLNYQQQPMATDTTSGSQMASASNQIMTTIQHPNSINAIITSENQPRSMQSNSILQQQMQAAPSQQIVTVNGQPMLLVNPNVMHSGGRRISISGWLKNISSILTNIFNRREHGATPNSQSSFSGGPLGHWMMGSGLGSHSSWLSGAQQMVQQPHTMLGSHRHQHQSLNYNQQPPAPQQQQLPVDLQTSASSNSYATITSPQAVYQPPMQMMQLNQVTTSVRQAPPIPLQQPQQVQTSVIPQPVTPTTSLTIQTGQQANIRPASLAPPAPTVVQQNLAQPPARPNKSPSNSGLPLAHYSRYSANMD